MRLLFVSTHAQTPRHTPQQQLTLLCFCFRITALAVVASRDVSQLGIDVSSEPLQQTIWLITVGSGDALATAGDVVSA